VKRLSVRSVVLLPVLIMVLLPFGPHPIQPGSAVPFQMRIIDPHTGQGLSHVRVITDTGLVCYTRADGSIFWTESSLMDRDVHFRVDGYAGGGPTIRVSRGGHAELRLLTPQLSESAGGR
jgi:hypothetical protein